MKNLHTLSTARGRNALKQTNAVLFAITKLIFLLTISFFWTNEVASQHCGGATELLAKWDCNSNDFECNGEENIGPTPLSNPSITPGAQYCPNTNNGCGQTVLGSEGHQNTPQFQNAICLFNFYNPEYLLARNKGTFYDPDNTVWDPENKANLSVWYDMPKYSEGCLNSFSLRVLQRQFNGTTLNFETQGIAVKRNGVLIYSATHTITTANVNGTPMVFDFIGDEFCTDGSEKVEFEVIFGLVHRLVGPASPGQPGQTGYDDVCLNGYCKTQSFGGVVPATCSGDGANDDAQILIQNFEPGNTYDYNEGETYTGTATYASGSLPIPADGLIPNFPNPVGLEPYTVRVFQENCFSDFTVEIYPIFCCVVPTGSMLVVNPATCSGDMANDDAQVIVTGVTGGTKVGISTGTTYTGPDFAGSEDLIGGEFTFTGLPNPLVSETYTVRVYESATCFVDLQTDIYNEDCFVPCTPPNGVTLASTSASCSGNTRNPDATVIVTNVNGGDRVGISPSISYSGPDYSNAFELVNGAYTFTDIATPDGDQIYTVRVYNTSDGCYVDETIEIQDPNCGDCTNLGAYVIGVGPDMLEADGMNNQDAFKSLKAPGFIDIALTKTVDVNTGNTCIANVTPFTWTISIVNEGTITATDVNVVDLIPEGLVITNVNPSKGAFYGSSGWDIGALNANETATLSITTVAQFAGSYINCAYVNSALPDNDPDSSPNNTDTEDEDDDDCAMIMVIGNNTPTIDKSFSPMLPRTNEPTRLTIKITNNHTDPITLTSDLVDVFPNSPGQMAITAAPNLYVSSGITPGGAGIVANANATSLTIPAGTILEPGLNQISLDISVPTIGDYCNEIPSGALMTDIGDNCFGAEGCLEANPTFDMAPIVTSRMMPEVINPGEVSNLVITIENRNGQDMTLNQDFISQLPPGLVVDGPITSTGNAATLENGDTEVNLPGGTVVPANSTFTITVPLRADIEGSYEYEILMNQITTTVGTNNNLGNEDVPETVLRVENLPLFDLALRKVLANGQNSTVNVGDEVVFTITVFNQGGTDATNLDVTDYFPTNTTYSSTNSTATGTLTSENGNTIDLTNNGNGSFTLDSLVAGDSLNFNVALLVEAGADGLLTNNAEIVDADGGVDEDSPLSSVIGSSDDTSEVGSDNELDDDGSGTPGTIDLASDEDDYDPAQFTVENIFDLALTKEVNTVATPGPYMSGDIVQFTITVTNQGTLNAFDVDVADYFNAAELSAPTLVAQAGVTDNGSGTFTIDQINVGSSFAFDVTSTIDPTFAGGSIVNNAEITGGSTTDGGTDATDEDSTPNNNSGSAPELGNDNVITDNDTGEDQDDDPFEDDFDPAEFTVVVDCNLTISAVPTPCDATDNLYDLVVTATYSNEPSGDVQITVGGNPPVTFTPDGTSPDDFTISGLNSDGTTDITVSAHFVAETDCDAVVMYDAPAQCFVPVSPPISCVGNPGDIGGTVYLDLDNDGVNDANESGQAGIIVMVYDCDGNLVGNTSTGPNGEWGITGLPDGPDDEYRIEFTFPSALSYLQNGARGADNGTSVQTTRPADCQVDFGVVDPSLSCQENPLVMTNCYLNGISNGGVIVSWNYNDAGLVSGGRPAPTYEADNNQIGSTWGLAYHRRTNTALTSAFLKRHSRLVDADGDNQGDLGAIYAISIDGNLANDNSPLWLNLDGAVDTDGNTISVGTIPDDAGRGINVLTNGPSHDVDAFDKVGKVGLGDIDLNATQDELWVVNLWEKKLHAIVVDANGAPGAIRSFDLPVGQCNGTGVNNDSRPFAVRYYQGGVYVGIVCSGENTGQLNTMSAYVYRLDDDGVSTTFNEVLSFPLTYNRDAPDDNGGCNSFNNWLPWTNTWPGDCCCGGRSVYPQPILSDIEFNIVTGEMIIGFIDRFGHQAGFDNYNTTPGNTTLFGAVSGGEILKSTPDGDGTYTIESNIASGNEFYIDDFFDTGNGSGHDEIGVGGLAMIPGANLLVATAFDPINGQGNQGVFNSGGVIKLNNSTGQKENNLGYQIFNGSDVGTLGKAAGLGDIELLCDPYLIEIGNYVWEDTDEDGVQDACESPIPNLPVTLIDKATGDIVAVTTTDANGQYYFSETANELEQNTSYAIVFGYDGNTPANSVVSPGGIFSIGGVFFELTTPDAVPSVDGPDASDLNDSDASIMTQGSLVGYPIIMYETADTTDHTLDVGLVQTQFFDLALTKTLNTAAMPGPFMPGSTVQFSIKVYNQGTLDAFDIDVADYYNAAELSMPTLVAQAGVTDNGDGTFTIDEINARDSLTFDVTATIDIAFTGTSIVNNAEITGGATTDGGPNALDEDSTPNSDSGSTPETGNDNIVFDNDTGSSRDDDPFEDDFDPAEFTVEQLITPTLEIVDPCVCFDVEYDLPDVDPYEFTDSIKVNAPAGQAWRVYDYVGIESIDSFVNQVFPLDTLLTEQMPGMYTMKFAHTANVGYTIFVTNTPLGSPMGTPGDTLSIGATCYQPEPFTPNLPFMELICPDDQIALEGAANFNGAPLAGGSFTYDLILGSNPGDTLFNQTEISANQFVSGTTITVLGRYTPPAPADPTINGGNGFCGHTFYQEVTFDDAVCDVFDLALIKEVNTVVTPSPYIPGNAVQFTITVTNQGTLDAFDIDIADYFVATELSAPTLVAQVGVTDNGNGTFTIDQVAAGNSLSFDVVSIIDASFIGGDIVNNAEITGAAVTDGGPDEVDFDSTPNNNSGSSPEIDNDNVIVDNDNGNTQDDDIFEDDFDPAVITVECTVEVVLANPFSICSSQMIRLNSGASIFPAGLGGTWSTPDGTGTFTTGQNFDLATTYEPSSEDINRGTVTLTLTTNGPVGSCPPVSASVIIEILRVDCGAFWDGN